MLLVLLLALTLIPTVCRATIARPTVPPRGWNSYDSGATTEADMLNSAAYLQQQLKAYNYTILVCLGR